MPITRIAIDFSIQDIWKRNRLVSIVGGGMRLLRGTSNAESIPLPSLGLVDVSRTLTSTAKSKLQLEVASRRGAGDVDETWILWKLRVGYYHNLDRC